MIERQHSADRINVILNHPAIRPWVANDSDGVIDLSETIADSRNVVLMGAHGGIAFLWMQPGVYEAHTQVLPAGRGGWTCELTEACARHMFTKTDAYDIATRVPAGHVAAKAAAEAQGMRYEFTRPDGVRFRNRIVDAHLYSFRLQDWVPTGAGLVQTGQWFHERLHEEAARLGIQETPHTDDENHNRYLGAAVEMVFGGQTLKGLGFYNRWVSMSRQAREGKLQHVSLVSVEPTIIQFDLGFLKFSEGDIEVIRSC